MSKNKLHTRTIILQNLNAIKNIAFQEHVAEGLRANPKYLSSRYFYDEIGDALFQKIMAMPEYYLTNSEMEIFTEQASKIIEAFGMNRDEDFELVELGAGDGTKTIKLLTELQRQHYNLSLIHI